MSDSNRNAVETTYADEGIDLRVDNGQIRQGGQFIDDLTETFDHGGAHGWTLTGLWQVTDDCATPSSAPYYLGFHREDACNYDTGSTVSGEARVDVVLNNADSATLTFDHMWETEDNSLFIVDWMFVEVSTDNGNNWKTIDKWNSSDPNQLQWQSESYSLDSFVGNRIDLRFRFTSNDTLFNIFAGWFVDNVVVSFKWGM